MTKTDGSEDKLNHPRQYELLSHEYKQLLVDWIKSRYVPAKETLDRSSYGLKHDFEYDTKVYVSNGAFKGAMIAAGFSPVDKSELNWCYNIQRVELLYEKNSFYSWCIENYLKSNTYIGDLARDINGDLEFPKKTDSPKKEINEYLRKQGARQEVIDVFHRAWTQYKKKCPV